MKIENTERPSKKITGFFQGKDDLINAVSKTQEQLKSMLNPNNDEKNPWGLRAWSKMGR